MAPDPRKLAISEHQRWLGYLQPEGLVVSPLALVDSQVQLDTGSYAASQERFLDAVSTDPETGRHVIPNFAFFARDFLGWQDKLLSLFSVSAEVPDGLKISTGEHGEILQPDAAYRALHPADPAKPWLLLIRQIESGASLDQVPDAKRDHGWIATPHQKFERLLRETGVPTAILSETKHTGTGSELTTSWTYFHDSADQGSFNKPATMRRSDGQWSNTTYQGNPVTGTLVTKTVSGWLDNAAPAIGTAPDENANRVVTEFEAKNETGTVTLHRHAMQGDNRVETIDTGVGTLSGVTDGTRTVSTYTKDDVLIAQVTSDIASGIELSAKHAIAFDSNDQPTRWAHDNNPDDYSETINGCCGIDSEHSRDGILTTYTRDGLKRPKTATSRGVTLTYTYGRKTIGGADFPSISIAATGGNLTDPVTGRWPSRDPIGEAAGRNIYSFVMNTAIGSIDFLGKEKKETVKVVTTPPLADPRAIKPSCFSGNGKQSMTEYPIKKYSCECYCNKKSAENPNGDNKHRIQCEITFTATIQLDKNQVGKSTIDQIFGHEQQHVLQKRGRVKKIIEEASKQEGGPFISDGSCKASLRKWNTQLSNEFNAIFTESPHDPELNNEKDPRPGNEEPFNPLDNSTSIPSNMAECK